LLMKVLIMLVLLAGALGAGVVHAAGGSSHFSITPASIPHSTAAPRGYFTYTSQPGVLIHDSVHVTNVGTARGSVNLYAVDAITSQASGVAFLTPADPRRNVGAWITLSSQKITLNPGQSLDVPFSVRVPSKVRPGQHCGGIIARDAIDQVQSSTSGAVHTTIQVQSQEILGVLVNLPGTLVEKLNVTGITYDGKSASQRLLIGLANTGTQMIHPAGSLQVTDKERRLLQNVPLKLAAILPQTAINYPVGIVSNALNSGPYRASVSLGYEGGHTTKYEASFVVPRPQPSTKQTLPKSATSQILPKPVTNQAIPRAVSDIATPYRSPAFFNILTPWYYIVGLLIIMLILAAMFPWSRRLYRPLARLRQRSK